MAGIIFSKKDLTSLVDYHIALLERFGFSDEEPFSIIYFLPGSNKEAQSVDMIKKILRQSDALFELDNAYVILLTCSDWNGANELLAGIQDFLGQKICDNLVSYPEDGTNAKALLERLESFVEKNTNKIVNLKDVEL